ncbi:peptide ABC transporter substrate-binding protein [Labrenzia sp. C1B10]|uniref:ABC transporter substrate-binding protein n=1 Tax=unclassified Labrenzia TaxID=2648686 RepID=UPI0003B8E926|nr:MULTISPECIES: ABC transporter substrate-binding protein [unclassified Labrenzia]ERP94435.1 peptide ABC transporter substrate-binding protein [Labrenzia sp. C1B10]ERS09592.1 peptide ABC transporter substrate-binding protein [Labrenzia sp. C1B70]
MKATALATVLAMSTALSVFTYEAASAVERGGTLQFARYDGSKLIDPIYADRNPDIWMVGSLFSTLLESDPQSGAIIGALAEKYEVAADGMSITLTLRDGLKFSDGSPLTGEDVVFSLDRARNPDLGPWSGLFSAISSVTADGEAITISLANPDPALLSMLATFNSAIVSKKAFEAAPGATDQEKSAAIFASGGPGVGAGPFYLSGFEQGSSMTFTANPHYWKMGEDGKPLPYLDKVHFQDIPDDATRILKLTAGEVDIAEFIPFSRVAELDADPAVNMYLFPSTRIIYSPINTRETRADGSPNPLADKRVRQALNYATHKDALIQLVLQGAGKPMSSPLMSSSTPLAIDMSPLYGFDIEKAKALVAEAGLAPGTEIALTTLAGSADDATIFAALQQMWAPLGINLVAEQVDGPTRGAKNRTGEFDIHTYGWVDDVSDPSQVTGWLGYFPTREAVGTGWNNAEFNALYEASSTEMDPEKRADQYRNMQELYADAAPLLFMYETPFAVAVSGKVSGYVQTPLGANIFEKASMER